MISVVILSYCRGQATVRCLDSLIKNSVNSYEIIVVEQTGQPEIVEELQQQFLNVCFVSSPKNLGVAGGRNYGSTYAKGDYILFLDNDCELFSAWDKELNNILRDCKPDVLTTKLELEEADCPFLDFTNRPQMWRYKAPSNSIIQTNTLRGVAFHNADLFRKLGGFDTQYFIGVEDYDYAMSARDYRLFYTNNIMIYHKHDCSDTAYEEMRQSERYKNESRVLFRKKWGPLLKDGTGNLLLNKLAPLEMVEQLIWSVRKNRVRYEFFSSVLDRKVLVKKATQIHNIDVEKLFCDYYNRAGHSGLPHMSFWQKWRSEE